jgi:predicted acylesterase/phospholipase RssA
VSKSGLKQSSAVGGSCETAPVPYYHVQVIPQGSTELEPMWVLDLTRNELERWFLAPRREGASVTFRGHTHGPNEFAAMRVRTTDASSEELERAAADAPDHRIGALSSGEPVNASGRDLTNELLLPLGDDPEDVSLRSRAYYHVRVSPREDDKASSAAQFNLVEEELLRVVGYWRVEAPITLDDRTFASTVANIKIIQSAPLTGDQLADAEPWRTAVTLGKDVTVDLLGGRAGRSVVERGLWLNLSGGGFRATVFHYGCLRRLHEVGLADRIEGISATSGGAIAAALWDMHRFLEDDPESAWRAFEHDLLSLVRRGVIGPTAVVVAAWFFFLCAIAASFVVVLANPGHSFTLVVGGAVAVALALQAVLATKLACEGALRSRAWYGGLDQSSPRSNLRVRVRSLANAATWPSHTRRYTMDLRIFRGFLLKHLDSAPLRVFFNAVNLEEGRQAVIGPRAESGLTKFDLERQWKSVLGRAGDWRIEEETPLAVAVAARTAFPPWFAPVPLVLQRDDEKRRQHFLDGGVTDNAGFKLARGLARHSGSVARDPRRGSGWWAFKDVVCMVLTVDASRPQSPRAAIWSRVRGGIRAVQIAQNAQAQDLRATTEALRDVGLHAAAIGLQAGFSDVALSSLNQRVAHVRTHLDGFTIAEITAVSYCGYSWIDYLLRHGYLESLTASVGAPSASSLVEFAASMSAADLTVTEIARQMQNSHRLWTVDRPIRRWRERRRQPIMPAP